MMGKFGSADHGDWGSIVSNSTGLVSINPSGSQKQPLNIDLDTLFPELLCTVKGLQDS